MFDILSNRIRIQNILVEKFLHFNIFVVITSMTFFNQVVYAFVHELLNFQRIFGIPVFVQIYFAPQQGTDIFGFFFHEYERIIFSFVENAKRRLSDTLDTPVSRTVDFAVKIRLTIENVLHRGLALVDIQIPASTLSVKVRDYCVLFLCYRQIFVFVLDLTYIFHAGKVLVKSASEIAIDLSQLKHFHLSALLEINVYFVKESHCNVCAVDSHANLEGVQQVFVDQLVLVVFDQDAFFDAELGQLVTV